MAFVSATRNDAYCLRWLFDFLFRKSKKTVNTWYVIYFQNKSMGPYNDSLVHIVYKRK